MPLFAAYNSKIMEETHLMPFEATAIRKIWHQDEWYFNVSDVIAILTDSKDPKAYWRVLKKRLLAESQTQSVSNCYGLKFEATDGKKYTQDAANVEGIFRIIMSVPSPKAEPLKIWMAQVSKERIEETENPELSFERMTLAFLRYDTEKFTALAIFTGKAPSNAHKVYAHEAFGTKTTYEFNTYVVAEQDEATLIASGSLFDLAILAIKYTLDTEGDGTQRFKFKRKLFELATNRGDIPIDKLHKLLTFAGEYMDLPPNLENEFQATTLYFESFKSDTKMHTTWRTRTLAETLYKRATGKTFAETLAELAEKEAEKEAEKVKTVLSMRDKTDFSVEKIADILGYDLAFVVATLAKHNA